MNTPKYSNTNEDVGHEIGELIKGLAHEGERAAVVVGTARLDVALERFLKRIMHHHPGDNDNLFDPDRPLGSFSAKIALAYRLGMIDPDLEHALQLVRRIRNEFAHTATLGSLSEAGHKSRVRELTNYAKKTGDMYNGIHLAIASIIPSGELLSFSVALAVFITCIEAASLESKPIEVSFRATLASPWKT